MYRIVLLSCLTILVSSADSDPEEVFINVDEAYFANNEVINVKAGSQISLECSSTVTGSTSVDYKWYLSEKYYTSQESQRTLASSSKTYTVTGNYTNSGYYMCLISAAEGYSVYTPIIHVIVEYFDVEKESDEVTVEPYEKVTVLKCSDINANPTPTVTWKKNGIEVSQFQLYRNLMVVTGNVMDSASDYNIAKDDFLIINYKDDYAGEYNCEVTATGTLFTGNTSVAKSYTVKTAASSNLMLDNSTQILFTDNGGKFTAGDALTLRCGASGYPTPTYKWFDTNGNALSDGDTYELKESDTRLVVRSVAASDDEAEYTCSATSGTSKFVEAIRLTLSDLEPAFNSSMDNSQYDIPGATVIINFSLSTRGTTQMLWNGEDLGAFAGTGRGDLSYPNNVLTIANIQKNASGVFQHIEYNEAGMVTQYKTVIIRDAQPATVAHTTQSTTDITVNGNTIHSVRGANFTMQCTGSGTPTPSDITIDVPDDLSSSVASSLVKVNKEGKYIGNLLIDKVTEDYAGDYKCCTYNFVNGDRHESCVTIALAVEEKVTVTQNSADTDDSLVIGDQVYGTEGKPVTASCKATGLPRPTVTLNQTNPGCGAVSTITKSNDVQIIQIEYSNSSANCQTDTFTCCGKNEIQGVPYTACHTISVSFVEFQKPQDVKITNMGRLGDQSLVAKDESLVLNCSALSFPESDLTWQYRNSDDSDYQTIDNSFFSRSTTLSKGLTVSVLSSNGLAGDYFTGTSYDFKCTATNAQGDSSSADLTISITSDTGAQVSSGVYLGVGILIFIGALIAIVIMYIFLIISSGKKKKSDLGIFSCLVCSCCEPAEQPTEYADGTYNASLYSDKAYTMRRVDLYPEVKKMTFNEDEFDRSNVVVFNQNSEFDDRMFTLNTAVFKDPDVV